MLLSIQRVAPETGTSRWCCSPEEPIPAADWDNKETPAYFWLPQQNVLLCFLTSSRSPIALFKVHFCCLWQASSQTLLFLSDCGLWLFCVIALMHSHFRKMREKSIFHKSYTSKSENGCFNDEILQWWAALRLAFHDGWRDPDCQAAAANDQRWVALVRLETDLEERLRRERWVWLAPSQPGRVQALRASLVEVQTCVGWTFSLTFNEH